jgi:preprotein translocase subunit YajC
MDGGFLFVLVLLFAFMYLLLIRPQRQQQRRQAEMIQGLKPGDEIVTVGGIFGDITEVQDDRVSLEIAEDVEIEVAKRAIANVVPPEPADESDDGLVDEADADEREALDEPDAAGEPGARSDGSSAREDAARR